MASKFKKWLLKSISNNDNTNSDTSTNSNSNSKLQGKPYEKIKASTPPYVAPQGRQKSRSFEYFRKLGSKPIRRSEDGGPRTNRTSHNRDSSTETPRVPMRQSNRITTTINEEPEERTNVAVTDADVQVEEEGRKSTSEGRAWAFRSSSPFIKRRKSLSKNVISPDESIPATPTIPTSAHPLPHTAVFKAFEPDPSLSNIINTANVSKHQRNSSQSSRTAYTDVSDANTSTKNTTESSRDRAIASRIRSFDEDVASQNLPAEHRVDLSNPQFSYLRSIYYGVAEIEGPKNSRMRSLGNGRNSDDIRPPPQQASSFYTQSVSKSLKSLSTESRPNSPKVAPALPQTLPHGVASGPNDGCHITTFHAIDHDDDLATSYGLASKWNSFDRNQRDLSPSSNNTIGPLHTTSLRESRRQASNTSTKRSIPSTPARGLSQTSISSTSTVTMKDTLRSNRSQVPQTSHDTLPGITIRQGRDGPSMNGGSKVSSSDRTPRTIPSNYSAFPISEPDENEIHNNNIPSKNPRAYNNIRKEKSFAIDEQKDPINLEGVVDLTNTVDTDVTTKTLPAVVHEHVTPTRHEIIEERIFREIHHHDVYHRILPIIDTEFLPPIHFVYDNDGKLVEIPESMVPGRTAQGSYARNWQLVENYPQAATDPLHSMILGLDSTEEKTSNYTTDLRDSSPKTSLRWSRESREPIKIMERETISPEGIPRKETWWRHPPVLETSAMMTGQTVPMYWHYTDEEANNMKVQQSGGEQPRKQIKEERDLEALRPQAIKAPHTIGIKSTNTHTNSLPRKPITHQRAPDDSLLYNKKGYGQNSMSTASKEQQYAANSAQSYSSEKPPLGRVLGEDTKEKVPQEGEATKYLRRMRERRRSSASSSGSNYSFRSWGRRSASINRNATTNMNGHANGNSTSVIGEDMKRLSIREQY